MTRSHITALLVACAFGCSIPAWAIGPSQDAPDPTVQGHADQTQQKADASAPGISTEQPAHSQSDQNKASKHPPTAVMDRAMPPEKSTDEGRDAGKHPPSQVMERAVPEQKSPNSTGSQNADEGSGSVSSK